MLTSHPARTLITRSLPLHPSICPLLLPRRSSLFPSPSPLILHYSSSRPLTSSAPLREKKDKSSPPHNTTSSSAVRTTTKPEKGGKGPTSSKVVDPLDFSAFEEAIERILESLKAELAKLRHTGKSPEGIEALRVKLVKGSKDIVALGEIAQVIPRGRALLVVVGEKDHLKPILSALQSAPSSLSPQLSPTSPLEISIPIPPPTRDSREAALAEVLKRGEFAQTALKEARAVQKKRLRAMELEKIVRPDLLRKAEKQLEKVNDKGVGEVKKLMEAVKKKGSI